MVARGSLCQAMWQAAACTRRGRVNSTKHLLLAGVWAYLAPMLMMYLMHLYVSMYSASQGMKGKEEATEARQACLAQHMPS